MTQGMVVVGPIICSPHSHVTQLSHCGSSQTGWAVDDDDDDDDFVCNEKYGVKWKFLSAIKILKNCQKKYKHRLNYM